ncbi:xanthine dehydrogenase/oxidase-like isoform X3 [Biomphalaria glabrata]|nr:xanthine dehydrogenase/oxidase-like isoform X3 [Biomphalaria glabrata]XP_055891067.1 xanthine dehydrogenase/oxidase-like isoform X3 [Biomphalaria glabrata]XP_055891068.1 xanthine dehydrogenase/oxidase-like isoform X3 [Biomphalaria glabrata]XP_055891069.1 xanthine dehydrogenase/oxidase-like isoform X3 [Biomphalaria glabrata]XP_055891070.1 xanthine dehydrogenase/oxidase-like isoform X3 [Biomphalaria glabrata]
MIKTSDVLIFFVNGKKIELKNPDPELTLLEFLRKQQRLTGSKLGCGQGGCGACTVMISKYNSVTDTIEHWPANACLTTVCSLHGRAVTTVEGVGDIKRKVHPVQKQLVENHGTQCGFCTPGFIMSMYTLLRNNPKPTLREIQENFDGNLCRCTGYRPILQAFSEFSQERVENNCVMGKNCCKNGKQKDDAISNDNNGKDDKQLLIYDPTQEPIFPPELKINCTKLDQEVLKYVSGEVTWLSPASLPELYEIQKAHPTSVLVSGNTIIAMDTKLSNTKYPVRVHISRIQELNQITETDFGIKIGASLSIAKVNSFFKMAITKLPEYKTRILVAFVELFKRIANHQIRSVASIAGNIMSGTPSADIAPLLLASKAVVTVHEIDGTNRDVVMDDNFFIGNRKTCLKDTDTIICITLPFTKQIEYIIGYKQAYRKESDSAIINAGMWVHLTEHKTVADIRLVFGGMADKVVFAKKTMSALKGKKWDESLLELACSQDLLPADLPLSPGSVGGLIAYRRTLTLSFFFKFFTTVGDRVKQNVVENHKELSIKPVSIYQASQIYDITSPGQSENGAVGQPIVHRSAYKQATGEAVYVDDVPKVEGELFCGVVCSTKANAKLIQIDPSKALDLPGVVDFVTYKDVPNDNFWDSPKDYVFAEQTVEHEGQIIGLILADSLTLAQKAAKLVEVVYEELPAVVTIQDAIKRNSIFESSLVLKDGDVDEGLSTAESLARGEFHMDSQQHFYLEPQGCIVYPRDSDEIDIVCMGQSIDLIQVGVSKVLGIPENQVTVRVKRIGGGFGGKVIRHACVVLPAAVAAHKTGRPVRLVLERDHDMKLIGSRRAMWAQYQVGFTKNGKVTALKMTIYLNCGATFGYSSTCAERILLFLGSNCKIPNLQVDTVLCKTNIATTTPFRGFGNPQAISLLENILDHVAVELGIEPEVVRKQNLYNQGDTTAFGQLIEQCSLQDCWTECQKLSQYNTRKQEVEEFNRCNRWKKRGLSIAPTAHGIGFSYPVLNKGSALVNIFKDGSVVLIMGGVEVGQGLSTKMIQVVSQVLDIPVDYIKIAETRTDVVPNTPPTAASMTSDLVGMAVVDACQQLCEKLKNYRTPNKPWTTVIGEAIGKRESLSAFGYYKPDCCGMDWTKKVNSPFMYFTYGVGCSVVEIDCLTGDHQVLSTDIVMDVGHSLNPAIDVGQIEGAFMQGYGLWCLEQVKMTSQGKLLSNGPGNYKVPSLSTIPQSFNISLLKTAGNPKAVYSSKAIGEPSLCLAISVFMAIKAAIRAARLESGYTGHFTLDSPATPDRVRMACLDRFTEQFLLDDQQDKIQPYFVRL